MTEKRHAVRFSLRREIRAEFLHVGFAALEGIALYARRKLYPKLRRLSTASRKNRHVAEKGGLESPPRADVIGCLGGFALGDAGSLRRLHVENATSDPSVAHPCKKSEPRQSLSAND